MKFIDQLKAFELQCGCLTMQAQMIYYKLFKNSNLHGLGLPFYITNEDLMREALIKNKQAFLNARNQLIQQGFIQFRSGKKGSPSVYRLIDLQKRLQMQLQELKDTDDEIMAIDENTGTNRTEKQTESVPESVPKSVPQSVPENRQKAVHNKAIANANAKAKAKAKNIKPQKIEFAESVKMTQEEYDKLKEQLGNVEAVSWCINKLNNYKLSSGKKYQSDYRAILTWVIDAYNRDGYRQSQKSNNEPQGFNDEKIDWSKYDG